MNMQDYINAVGFQEPRVTKIYWEENELFKPAKDEPADKNTEREEENEPSDDDNV